MLQGVVDLYFRTSSRILVLHIKGEPDRLFMLKLPANPPASPDFGPWQRVDSIDDTARPGAAESGRWRRLQGDTGSNGPTDRLNRQASSPVNMDGSSIDCGLTAPLKLPPNRTNARVPKEVFHALSRFPQALRRRACRHAVFAGLASQARAEETSPCFTGDGSIKEVLDSCAAYIASGSTDKDKLITAHSVRAMAFSAVRDLDSAIAEMDKR